jgi:hypothetical protein
VLGASYIGYGPPETACRGQTTKTPFEEDVRFVGDCDTVLAICQFAGPRLLFDSLTASALIVGESPALILHELW